MSVYLLTYTRTYFLSFITKQYNENRDKDTTRKKIIIIINKIPLYYKIFKGEKIQYTLMWSRYSTLRL